MSDQPSSKEAAGRAAAPRVESGMRLGLGTGSTVDPFLAALAERIAEEGLQVSGVPTSEQTARRCRELGVPLTTLEETPALDLAVDGADEADAAFRLIKGGGGALLREKIVARAAAEVVIVVGEGKMVDRLGRGFLLPVEVLPFGCRATTGHVEALGCQPFLRSLGGAADAPPFVTDNGNWILDCRFDDGIADPEGLHAALHDVPGVIESGLFLDLCQTILEGRADGSVVTHQKT